MAQERSLLIILRATRDGARVTLNGVEREVARGDGVATQIDWHVEDFDVDLKEATRERSKIEQPR